MVIMMSHQVKFFFLETTNSLFMSSSSDRVVLGVFSIVHVLVKCAYRKRIKLRRISIV